MESPTVTVALCEGCHLIRVAGQYGAEVDDVVNAFQQVKAYLDDAVQPMDVLIDLRYSSRLPFLLNTKRMLHPVAAHPRRGRWMLIGSYAMTHVVRRIIRGCGQYATDILCFSDEEHLLKHIAETEPVRSSSYIRAALQYMAAR
jgi:hypothetical protein